MQERDWSSWMVVGSKIVRSRFRGCLLGCAVGDALGAAVEFMDRASIFERFGPDGIRGFEPWENEVGIRLAAGAITDDTQMSVGTASGLLDALSQWRARGVEDAASCVWERYRSWLDTQQAPAERRFPGATCLSALRAGIPGTVEEPVNHSKGSGGVMRVAPTGLAYVPEQAFEHGAEFAALTHGHPSGYLAAGFLAQVVSRLVRGASQGSRQWSEIRGGRMAGTIAEARETLVGWDDNDEVLEKVDLAVELYIANARIDEAVSLLGEGWIAEEALGIALFCALNFPEDFDEGVLAAVNITGDSDTTGSMTGALLGASLGEYAIPHPWATGVELSDTLVCLADELYSGYVEDGPADVTRCLG